MKYKTLKSKKINIVFGICLLLITMLLIVSLTTSRSSYKFEKSYPLVKGTSSYTLPDLNVIAMYKQASKGSTEYTELTTAPTSGYIINAEKSVCGSYNSSGGINKDNDIIPEMLYGKVAINGLKKGTRCLLYFDVETTSDTTLNKFRELNRNIPPSRGKRTNFGSIISSGNYTYQAPDDLGTSYYFAGAVNTNWVKLGDSTSGYTYWRIVRINGNGSVRLIYSGTESPTESEAVIMLGTKTRILAKAFNSTINDNTYAGFMYGNPGQNSWTNTHKNINSSTIKVALDTWYSNNKSGFESYIDPNVGFCGDRSASSSPNGTPGTGAGYGTNQTFYGAYLRLGNKKTPDLTCNKSNSTFYNNDLYTKSGSSIGNKALTYPIGLITADEVALAGDVYTTSNKGYYLYTNVGYWTMSPLDFNTNNTWVGEFIVNSSGSLFYCDGVGKIFGVRPVINLKSNLTWSGKGTWDSPFIPSL